MVIGCIGAFIPSTCSTDYGFWDNICGEYNDIHYTPAALPCIVMSEPQLPRVAKGTRILLASLRMYSWVTAVTSLCTYLCTSVCIYVRSYVCMY